MWVAWMLWAPSRTCKVGLHCTVDPLLNGLSGPSPYAHALLSLQSFLANTACARIPPIVHIVANARPPTAHVPPAFNCATFSFSLPLVHCFALGILR